MSLLFERSCLEEQLFPDCSKIFTDEHFIFVRCIFTGLSQLHHGIFSKKPCSGSITLKFYDNVWRSIACCLRRFPVYSMCPLNFSRFYWGCYIIIQHVAHLCFKARATIHWNIRYNYIISSWLYCSKSSHLWWDVISSALSLVTANASFSTDRDRDVAVCADTVSSPESELFLVTAFAATIAAVDICSVIFDWIPATETGAGWISSAVIHLS